MTNIEIEAKVQVSDVGLLQQRIADSGGTLVGEHLEINTYFDTTSGSLRSTDQGLRVRVEQGQDSRASRVTMSHKGPRVHGRLKTRAETELVVSDARGALEFLSVLGYSRVLTFEKRRRRWRLDDCVVDVDTVPYLEDFVEIEGPSEQSVLAVRRKLGLDDAPLIQASYVSMLWTYLAEHRINIDVVSFDNCGESAQPAPGADGA